MREREGEETLSVDERGSTCREERGGRPGKVSAVIKAQSVPSTWCFGKMKSSPVSVRP